MFSGKLKFTPLRKCFWVFCLVFLFFNLATSPAHARKTNKKVPFTHEELKPLLSSLEEEGFSRGWLEKIFFNPRLRKGVTVISLNAVNIDGAGRYEQFLSRYAIKKAKRFRRKHFTKLEKIEKKFGVSKDIVVGILLVETQFGRAYLPFRVLEVFTTLVVEANPASLATHFKRLKHKYPGLSLIKLQKRMYARSLWAYSELVSLLKMGLEQGRNLYEIRGSYAGALGMPQFLPSSYLRWAVDGNGDEKVNLNHTHDAIASIANYLVEHGWTTDAGLKAKMRAVWKYNNSTDYVNAIFRVSRKINLPPKKRRRRTIATVLR